MIFKDNEGFEAFSWYMLLAHQLFPGKMRWTTSKYALLTFLLTPFFPANILFSQLYFVTDAHSVWSFSNKEIEIEKHPD